MFKVTLAVAIWVENVGLKSNQKQIVVNFYVAGEKFSGKIRCYFRAKTHTSRENTPN